MIRHSSETTAKKPASRSHPAIDRPGGEGRGRSRVVVLVSAFIIAVTVPGRAVAADGQDWSGPFHARGRSSSNLVGGYSAGGGRHLRLSRVHIDVLRRKLGDDFNPELMSIEAPPLNLTDDVVQSSFNVKLYEDLLRHVDFSLRDEVTGATGPLKQSLRKYLERWLLERASCPLRPAWVDLGALFWPRWVRRGSCGDNGPEPTDARSSSRRRHTRRRRRRRRTKSCSWPPGMRCVPEAPQTIRLLRWHCSAGPSRRRRRLPSNDDQKMDGSGSRATLRRQRHGRRRPGVKETVDKYGDGEPSSPWEWRCRWKKVSYPVTTACFCSC